MPVSEQTYKRVALEDPEGCWELHRGRLRQKPPGTFDHNGAACQLGFRLMDQLDRSEYHVRINAGRLRRTAQNFYVPDVFVIPDSLTHALRGLWDTLEAYDDPVPLVVEVWEPPSADYDIGDKLTEYQLRGDREIWWLHPYSRTVTSSRRQADGTYAEAEIRGGIFRPVAVPNVAIDLDVLFDT